MKWAFAGLVDEVLEAMPCGWGPSGAVYAIEIRPGVVKVGWSKNVRNRVRAIDSHQRIYGGCPAGRVAVTPEHSAAKQTETMAHSALRGCWVDGELFQCTIDDVGRALAGLAVDWSVARKDASALVERASRQGALAGVLEGARIFNRLLFCHWIDRAGLIPVAKVIGARPNILANAVSGGRNAIHARWGVVMTSEATPEGLWYIERLFRAAGMAPGVAGFERLHPAIKECLSGPVPTYRDALVSSPLSLAGIPVDRRAEAIDGPEVRDLVLRKAGL